MLRARLEFFAVLLAAVVVQSECALLRRTNYAAENLAAELATGSARFTSSNSETAKAPLSEIPTDWREAYDRRDLLWTNNESAVKYRPEVGNGFVATVVGTNKLYAAGVFNGKALDPSHRAEITSPIDLHLNGFAVAAALDLRNAVYIRRYIIKGSTVDLRFYAHRVRKSLLVVEVHVVSSKDGQPVHVQLRQASGGSPSGTDFQWSTSCSTPAAANATCWFGKTRKAEVPSAPVTEVAVVFPSGTLKHGAGPVMTVVPGVRKAIVVAVRTSLESESPLLAATQDWQAASSMEAADLFVEHSSAWARLWESGMEIHGRMDVAAAINSSIYYILSSVREDTVHSLSPGGLASNGYNGHSFWDCETWMYPTMVLWHPSIAESLLQYRVDRVDQAKEKALSYGKGYKGAMFPWESAASGAETCPTWASTGQLEQHITGDIAFAAQQYWYATRDYEWLRKVYPSLLHQTAEFWVSRVSIENNVSHIRGVVPPDEYRDKGIDDSVYTNFVAQTNLRFSAEAGEICGEEPELRHTWLKVADTIPILFDEQQGIHPEYNGYRGEKVKQADAVLLGFPLMMNMSAAIRKADFEYYAPRTDNHGPAMTWAMHAIGYMEVEDEPAKTALNYNRSFANAQSPFLVWSETPKGGVANFITGAGGFLQASLFGLAGLRIRKRHLAVKPALVEGLTSAVARGIHYRDAVFDISFDQDSMTFKSRSGAPLSVTKDGQVRTIQKGSSMTMTRGYARIRVRHKSRSSEIIM